MSENEQASDRGREAKCVCADARGTGVENGDGGSGTGGN
jgi:hypothetical protein